MPGSVQEYRTVATWRDRRSGGLVEPPTVVTLTRAQADVLWSAGCVVPAHPGDSEERTHVRFRTGKGLYSIGGVYHLPREEAEMWVRRGFANHCLPNGDLPPCDENTPRCSGATDMRVPTRPCCLGHVATLLTEIDELLTPLGISWWLDYGSLLGAVRHRGPIPHDKDGDIGVFAEDWQGVMDWLLTLEDRGRHVIVKEPTPGKFSGGNSIKVRLSRINHANVDVFPWHLGEDGLRHRRNYIGVDHYKGREFPEDKLLPLQRIRYGDLMLPAPADPLWFVAHRYGPMWRTPVRANNDGQRR